MSVTDIGSVRGKSALERVVAAARQLEQHEEVDRWEFAEDVREAVDELSSGENGFRLNKSGGGGRHHETGLYAAIDQVNGALFDAGVVSVGSASIRGAYMTAKAWEGKRVENATYWAHYELRGRDWDGLRQRTLQRLVEQSSTGKVGPKDVRLWKAGQRLDAVIPFLEQIEQGVRGVLLRKGRPWGMVSEGDRDAISAMLRQVAGEIAREEFGR